MSETYLYARVSTARQKLQRQIDSLTKEYPIDKHTHLVTEKYTASTNSRPEFQKMLKKLSANDTLVVESTSRFSRNASEAMELYEELVFSRRVNLVFLKEPQCNSSIYKEALERELPTTGDEISDTLIEAVNKILKIIARKQIETCFEHNEQELTMLHSRISAGMACSNKKIGRETGRKYETKKSSAVKSIIKEKSKTFGGSMNDVELITYINGTDLHLSRNSFYKYKKELCTTHNNMA